MGEEKLMGIWRIARSAWLQNLVVGSVIVFNSAACGDKFMGITNRMGMKLFSKLCGMLVV